MKQIRTAHICELIVYGTKKKINGIMTYNCDNRILKITYNNGNTDYYDITTIDNVAKCIKEINKRLNEYRQV